jgi:hypothetical protein
MFQQAYTKAKVTYIKWCDATSNENAWRTLDEALDWADNENWEVENIGWILKETREYILLATKRSKETEDLDSQYGNLFKIPKTWIRERKNVKL